MVLKGFQTSAMEGLNSAKQLDLLDSIDSLRSQGISHYISLPQIIVCGDQSSGKSSVLEAISGISFPIKSNLCTRFPTELVLRKTSKSGVKVRIVPHHSRTEAEQQHLGDFSEELDGFEGLPDLVESAKIAMGLSTHGKAFSRDLLRIEISGPDRPHVTIVDLPGLIHSETKQQSASDVELVQEVVQTYMKEPRSIILAVVSAKNDYANQVVLKLARAADPRGSRTLGVITKPDKLRPGSESEAMFASLAKNQDVEFRLGWHVLRNMDSEEGRGSMKERDEAEKEFFAAGIWTDLSQQLLGIDTFRQRLSDVLLSQIAAELPSLITEIETKSDACRRRLAKLGEPRATLAEQQLYLFQISQQYQSLVRAAIDGTYNEDFFEDAGSERGYQKRIRAVTQNLNESFAERMATHGHFQDITDSAKAKTDSSNIIQISRKDYMDHVRTLLRRTRGRELPGTFNPMIVADLFRQQSSPWEALTLSHVTETWKAVKKFIALVVAYIPDESTSKALLQQVFEPAMAGLLEVLNARTLELLSPHQKSHPITYNRNFTETIQKARSTQMKNRYSETLLSFFQIASIKDPIERLSYPRDLRILLNALVDCTEPDMNRFACSEALVCMESYYKVSRIHEDQSARTQLIRLVKGGSEKVH